MASGKSIDALKVAYNYEEQGLKVIVFVPRLDTRNGVGKLKSRIGLEREAIAVEPDTKLLNIVKATPDVSCVIVDEAQFLSEANVLDLAMIADHLKIPVLCYGLKNDFQNHLFEGSRALLQYADKVDEIKSICRYCKGKATMNLRVLDGKPIYTGEQVLLGGNEAYYAVCRRHWFDPPGRCA
jgi:thymidine kinase